MMVAMQGPASVVPALCPRGPRTSKWEHIGVSLLYLKNCLVIKSCLEAVRFKQIWYKTGSQWPGEFSHLGTRSENVLSAQSSNRPTKQQVGRRWKPRPWWGPCLLDFYLQSHRGCLSLPQSLRISFSYRSSEPLGRRWAENCKKPPVPWEPQWLVGRRCTVWVRLPSVLRTASSLPAVRLLQSVVTSAPQSWGRGCGGGSGDTCVCVPVRACACALQSCNPRRRSCTVACSIPRGPAHGRCSMTVC